MSDLNSALQEVIKEECDKYLGNVGKAQIKKIVNELLPEIDKIIAKHVKEHLTLLGNKIVEIFQTKIEE